MIAKANKNDVAALADLHILSLPNELLSKLGKDFLTEIYRVALDHSDSCILTSSSKKGIHGFIFLSKNPNSFYKKLIRTRFPTLTVMVLRRLLFDVSLINKMFLTARHVLFSKSESTPEILVFSVHPTAQRNGIGSKLLTLLENKLTDDGINMYNVKTTSSNKKSNGFYRKNGLEIFKRFKIEKKEWIEYTKRL